MKNLLTSLAVLISTSLAAQTDLHVSNNANTYIFVDGNGFSDSTTNVAPLYVTNNINLAGANSFIYLRNEAQLLQGAGSNGNSGAGTLSVYQEGTSSEYQYNYWCSPIGATSSSTVSNPFGVSMLGDVVDIRNSNPAIVTHNANYNGLANPLTIEERWIYTYPTPSSLYTDWVPNFSASTINPGEGFTMKGTAGTSANNPGDNQRYDFRGKPNTGTFSMPVAGPVGGVGQQTLVGNPYPSAIDAVLYLYDLDNVLAIEPALYYWEQADINSHLIADYEGGYASYTINAAGTVESYTPAAFRTYDGSGNDTGPSGNTSDGRRARRYIPVGQGFMVEGFTGTTGTVQVKNNMRLFYKETSSNSEFFRSNDSDEDVSTDEIQYNEYGLSIVPADYKRFRINVEFNNLYKRQLLQNFHATATDGFDRGLEAKRPEGITSDAHWVLNDEAYVIQAHSFDENLRIPLIVNVAESQSIGFSIFDIQNFDDSQPIYIHDIEANLYVDLRTQDYDINLPIGNYTDRFEVTFMDDSTLTTPEITEADFTIFQNNSKGQLTILNPNGIDVRNVRLYDIAGKQIFEVVNLNNQSEYHFVTKNLSEGVYVVSISVDGHHQIISKKVIVKN